MLRRNIEGHLLAALADTPVVLLQGPRQVGKTTLAREVSRATLRRYVTLDDSTTLAAAEADPEGFVGALGGAVVVDEVQRAPNLFRAIKAEVDRARTPGRFLLTGSANVLMLPTISDSLAGRIEIIPLWPLSQGEVESRTDDFVGRAFSANPAWPESAPGDLMERMLGGGYPEPLSRVDPSRRAAWFASYITTILQRDVRDLKNIERLADLPRLLALLASRTAGLLSFADLSRSLSVAQTTVKRYVALLEATFLVVMLPAWSTNRGLRLSKAPKVMLSDSGLCCHLLASDAARLAADGHARGIILENFVAMELLKQLSWSGVRAKLHHFRTSGGHEVDLVLEDLAGRVVGIEVKSAGSVHSDDFKGLRVLREATGEKFVRGLVLYCGREAIAFDGDLAAVPMNNLWA